MMIFTKEAQRKVDQLEKHVQKLGDQIKKTKRQIEAITVGQCPIKPGNIIEWISGGKTKRGRVVGIQSTYRGFELRCKILAKTGKEIGFANVTTMHHEPHLVTPEK